MTTTRNGTLRTGKVVNTELARIMCPKPRRLYELNMYEIVAGTSSMLAVGYASCSRRVLFKAAGCSTGMGALWEVCVGVACGLRKASVSAQRQGPPKHDHHGRAGGGQGNQCLGMNFV